MEVVMEPALLQNAEVGVPSEAFLTGAFLAVT